MSYGFASQSRVIERGTPVRDDREVCRSRTIVAQVTVAAELLGHVRPTGASAPVDPGHSLPKTPAAPQAPLFLRTGICMSAAISSPALDPLPPRGDASSRRPDSDNNGRYRARSPAGSLFAAMTVLTEWAL